MEQAPEQPLDNLPVVRILTLCDYAAGPPDGKLYIMGGGLTGCFLPQLPGPLPILFAVARIALPWQMMTERHIASMRLLDGDRQPVGETDPVFSAPFELGRPPGYRPGDESAVNLVVSLNGYPLRLANESTIYLHALLDDQSLQSVPLKVALIPPPTVAVVR